MKTCPICLKPSHPGLCAPIRLNAGSRTFAETYEHELAKAQRVTAKLAALGEGRAREGHGAFVESGNVTARHIACDASCPICKGIHRKLALSQLLNGNVSAEAAVVDQPLSQQSYDKGFQRFDTSHEVGQVIIAQGSLLQRMSSAIRACFSGSAQ